MAYVSCQRVMSGRRVGREAGRERVAYNVMRPRALWKRDEVVEAEDRRESEAEGVPLTFPALEKQFQLTIPPWSEVQAIPVHKTTQYPLSVMHIDEFSLEGTLGVINTIFRDSLQLSEKEVWAHGIVICGGNQLTLSLLDKV